MVRLEIVLDVHIGEKGKRLCCSVNYETDGSTERAGLGSC